MNGTEYTEIHRPTDSTDSGLGSDSANTSKVWLIYNLFSFKLNSHFKIIITSFLNFHFKILITKKKKKKRKKLSQI